MGTTSSPQRIISNTLRTFNATSSESIAAPRGVSSFRIIAVQAFHFKIGPPGTTAVTSDTYCAASREQYFAISEGQVVAIIRSAADGNAFISWCT